MTIEPLFEDVPTEYPKSASFSADGLYRYNLTRRVNPAATGRALFVMLNPSTADADKDDVTIRRCIGFVRDWDRRDLEVVNLFAYRSTSPKKLREVVNPAGAPENDWRIREAAERATIIVAAWGVHGDWNGRDRQVLDLLRDYEVRCLGRTKKGLPRHPLFVAAGTMTERFAAASPVRR